MPSKLKLSIVTIFISILFLSGCTSEITVPLSVNSIPLVGKSTLIFYHEDGCILGACDIFIDGQMVGKVTPRKPFKTDIESGQHELYVDPNILRGFLIRRISTQTFEKGKVYYLKIWQEKGMWVNSIRINLTEKVDNYTTKDYINPSEHTADTPVMNQAVEKAPAPIYQSIPVAQPQVIQQPTSYNTNTPPATTPYYQTQPQTIQQPIVQPVVEDTMPSYEQTYQQPQANTSGKDVRSCLALVDNAAIANCVRNAK